MEDSHRLSYTFGGDGFVRRFHSEVKGKIEVIDAPLFCKFRRREDGDRVSACRISKGYTHCSLQNRVVYRAAQ